MLLTDGERVFLAAFLHEATTDPFKGPATEELHRRNIYYTDLSHLLTAYYREHAGDQEGLGGKRAAAPTPCPWQDRSAAVQRDQPLQLVDQARFAQPSLADQQHHLAHAVRGLFPAVAQDRQLGVAADERR